MAALEPERAGARELGGRADAALVVRREQLGAAAFICGEEVLEGGADPVVDKESVLTGSRIGGNDQAEGDGGGSASNQEFTPRHATTSGSIHDTIAMPGIRAPNRPKNYG